MDLKIFNNSLSSEARKQKIKVFIIFILISFLFWGITKFSKNYSALVYFEINYTNTPDLVVIEPGYKTIEGYVNTSGFQLMIYRLIPKTLKVDMSLADYTKSGGIIDLISQRRYLEDQINGSFLSFENDKLLFDYSDLMTKKIKVNINTDINYASGYYNMNNSIIEPDSVEISGPESILNNLVFINTELISIDNVSDDLKMILNIEPIDSFIKIKPSKVFFHESVKRFTEQDFELQISVINVPDSIDIKLFPEKVQITASFPIDLINKVDDKDFELTFDYSLTENGKFESIPINLTKTPKSYRNVRWDPKTISYLIKK
ncbi:CdaR family protein [Flavobacteriaceae bacterium]|nr:CdaR family protein [Flavobacteriaceae bacterium]